jgi:hypothetical protein
MSSKAHQSSIVGEGVTTDTAPAAPETTVNSVALGDLASTGAEVAMPTKMSEADDVTVRQSSLAGGNVDAVVVASFKAERSVYELLATVSADQAHGVLPDPVDYQPSRFSQYRPDPYSDWSASNQGRGYLTKPSVMESVPYGFYVGTAFGTAVPVDGGDRYELPSFILGYSDERAVRDFNNYYGIGLRLEGMVARSKSKGTGLVASRHNSYHLLGEVYQPLGRGFFWGVGARYGIEKNEKLQFRGDESLGEVDTRGYDIYFPVGFGFATPSGQSGKVQFDFLLASRHKLKTSQLSRVNFPDVRVKRGFGEGFAVEFNFSPYPNFEPFVRYLWADSTGDRDLLTDGAVGVELRGSIDRSIEVGLRYYW